MNNKSPLASKASSCTVGNFDGLHLGHQRLIADTIKFAKENNYYSLALTFDPPPEVFFNKSLKVERLFTLDQKMRAFRELGLDIAVIESFNDELSLMSANDFIELYLLDKLNAKRLCIGDDFRFGYKRSGNIALLAAAGDARGFNLNVLTPLTFQDATVSSSRIRACLEKGDLANVAQMLGRPYLLEGHLEKGDQLGRTLGFPTLNLKPNAQLLPGTGVYVGYVYLADGDADAPTIMTVPNNAHLSVFNVGVRPTLSHGLQLRIEAHVIDKQLGFDGFYGRRAGFYFAEKIRDEKKFGSLDELKAAVHTDIAHAKEWY